MWFENGGTPKRVGSAKSGGADGQDGTYVYVVKDDQTVEMRP